MGKVKDFGSCFGILFPLRALSDLLVIPDIRCGHTGGIQGPDHTPVEFTAVQALLVVVDTSHFLGFVDRKCRELQGNYEHGSAERWLTVCALIPRPGLSWATILSARPKL